MNYKSRTFCITMIVILAIIMVYGIIVGTFELISSKSNLEFMDQHKDLFSTNDYGYYWSLGTVAVIALIIYSFIIVPILLLIIAYKKNKKILIYVSTGLMVITTIPASLLFDSQSIFLFIGSLIVLLATVMMLAFSVCNIFVKSDKKSNHNSEYEKLNQMFEADVLTQAEYMKERQKLMDEIGNKGTIILLKKVHCNKCKIGIEFYEDQPTIRCDKCGKRYKNPYYKE